MCVCVRWEELSENKHTKDHNLHAHAHKLKQKKTHTTQTHRPVVYIVRPLWVATIVGDVVEVVGMSC